jgi:hypothetical protein
MTQRSVLLPLPCVMQDVTDLRVLSRAYMEMLRDLSPPLNASSRWSATRERIRNDPRYKVCNSRSRSCVLCSLKVHRNSFASAEHRADIQNAAARLALPCIFLVDCLTTRWLLRGCATCSASGH